MISELDKIKMRAASRAAQQRAQQLADSATAAASAAKRKLNEVMKAPTTTAGVATGVAIGAAAGAGVRVLEEVIPDLEIYDGMMLPKSAVVTGILAVGTVMTGDMMMRDATIASAGVTGYRVADDLMSRV